MSPRILLILLASGLAAPAFAQPAHLHSTAPGAQQHVDQRQAEQSRRIAEGQRSGALTRHETRRLERGQAHIDRMEQRAQADGRLSRREAAQIERAQDRQSRHIRHDRHDRQHDFNHDGRRDRHEGHGVRHDGRRDHGHGYGRDARRFGHHGGYGERRYGYDRSDRRAYAARR